MAIYCYHTTIKNEILEKHQGIRRQEILNMAQNLIEELPEDILEKILNLKEFKDEHSTEYEISINLPDSDQ